MQASRTPLGEYLRARRALISPEDVGFPVASRRRRVAGLRRDEVAQLADVSAGYYLRLEQGHDRRPSPQVLQALSRALQLDASAFEYMTRLVQIQTDGRRPKKEPLASQTQTSIHALFSQWKHTPAYLMDGNQDVLMSNDLARAMAPGALEPGVNLPLLVFSEGWRAADPHWEDTAVRTAATLRYGSDPTDPRLHEIVGQLYLQNADFRRLWARHDARPHYVGPIDQVIAPFGTVSLTCQTLIVPGTQGHVLVVFHAEPGTVAAAAIDSLRERVTDSPRAADSIRMQSVA
jgi:transcriptional regulator with XRE-family HTH domain